MKDHDDGDAVLFQRVGAAEAEKASKHSKHLKHQRAEGNAYQLGFGCMEARLWQQMLLENEDRINLKM